MAAGFSARHALLCCTTLFALLCPAGVSAAAEKGAADATKYDLRYKFALGDVLRYSVEHRASIRATIDDTTQEANTRTDSVKEWKITDVLPNGDVEFMDVLKQVRCVNQLPKRAPTEYDSTKDEKPPPGYEAMAKSIGVPLSVVRITPRGDVVFHEIKIAKSDPNQEGTSVVRLPDQPVAIGDTWDQPHEVTVDLKSGGTKVIQTRRHYKLADVSNGVATIEASYQVLSPIDSHIESQLVQRLENGTVRFDIKSGRVISQRMDVDKSILGFAGPTSSMHYVMRREEELTDDTPEVARKP